MSAKVVNDNLFTGKIFKLLATGQTQPNYVIAISEPTPAGIVEILMILPEPKGGRTWDIMNIPSGIFQESHSVMFDSHFKTHISQISEPIASVSPEFLQEMLKHLILKYSKIYFNAIHRPKLVNNLEPGKSENVFTGKNYDEREIVNLIDASLVFWLGMYPYLSNEMLEHLIEQTKAFIRQKQNK